MDDLFRHWWILFPLLWFGLGGMRLWMSYRSQQAWLEVIKTYAARGEVPPPELAAMTRPDMGGDPWRARDRFARRGPLAEWRRTIIFTALAGGFFMASFITSSGEAAQAFEVVALIMAVMAVAFGAMAVLSTYMGRSPPSDEP